MADGDAVTAAGDTPAWQRHIVIGNHARLCPERYPPGLSGRERHTLECGQAHRRGVFRALHIQLRDVRSRRVSRIADIERDGQPIVAPDRRPGIGEGRVAEAVPEGEKRGQALALVPAIPDIRTFAIIDRETLHLGPFGQSRIASRSQLGGRQPVEPDRRRPRRLVGACRKGDRQPARGIDASGQYVGDGLAAPLARIPCLDDGGNARDPRHQYGAAGLEDHHAVRLNGGDGLDQRVLMIGEDQIGRVLGLRHPLGCEDNREVGTARGSRRRGQVVAIDIGNLRARQDRAQRFKGRGRVIGHPRERCCGAARQRDFDGHAADRADLARAAAG